MLNFPVSIFNKINEFENIKNLLNTSKKLNDVKKEIRYIKLDRIDSYKYYIDLNFREEINSKICNPNKQLSLNLSDCDNITDTSALGNVH